MSVWSRISNALQGERLNREIDEELQSHIDEAIASGRDPGEARRTFGSILRQREASHSIRAAGWLESLLADTKFGWRQLCRNKVTSVAAVLSLALGIGSCVAAFRLIDALLWRPLPVSGSSNLYELSRKMTGLYGKPAEDDAWATPDFKLMRDAVKGQADLIAISYTDRTDITWSTDDDMEKAQVVYTSGNMFPLFGLEPALGRLIAPSDDRGPGVDPYAVLSGTLESPLRPRSPRPRPLAPHRRPDLRNHRRGPARFHWNRKRNCHRHLSAPQHEQPRHPGQHRLAPYFPDVETRRRSGHRPRAAPPASLRRQPRLRGRTLQPSQRHEPGVHRPLSQSDAGLLSRWGRHLRSPERLSPIAWHPGLLAALVLLIACVNVANVMTAQAAARAHEMALRSRSARAAGVSSSSSCPRARYWPSWLPFSAHSAAWSAPFVLSLVNPPDNPARLAPSRRLACASFGFGLHPRHLILGLLPALRASAVRPVAALKGGEDMRTRHAVSCVEPVFSGGFCFLVLVALFTFRRILPTPTESPPSVSLPTVCCYSKPLPAKASSPSLSGIKRPRRSVPPPASTQSPSRAGPFSGASP